MNEMLEPLINLFIIFVIIISILKRFQEVSKKGEELKADEPQPSAIPHNTIQESVKEKTKSLRQLIEEISQPQLEKTEPEITPQWQESEIEKPVLFDVNKWESIPEIHESPKIEKPIISSGLSNFEESHREKYVMVPLNFKSPDLINGIIMSEILGKPVSLREEHVPR